MEHDRLTELAIADLDRRVRATTISVVQTALVGMRAMIEAGIEPRVAEEAILANVRKVYADKDPA